jgi:VPDSG-CTERM motif
MTMNRFKISAVLAATALVVALAGPAQAATYTIDTLLGAIDSDNSGQAYEEAQLEIACSCQVTLLSNVSSGFTVQTDDAGSNFIDVAPSTPGYFLLKFGTGSTGNDMFFFLNVPDLTKLVWTDAQLIGAGLPADHVQSISHYAITSSTVTTPDGGATLSLLGLALAGIGVARRYMSV